MTFVLLMTHATSMGLLILQIHNWNVELKYPRLTGQLLVVSSGHCISLTTEVEWDMQG